MNFQKLAAAAGIAAGLMGFGSAVLASATAADIARLMVDLTPTGAEKAGNSAGTIPAWTGGLTKPPAGWTPAMGYVDPFADEKPLFTITGANADQYKEKLSAGQMALLKKYPTFKMNVYPSHRTAALPEAEYAKIKAEAGRISMTNGSMKGRVDSSVPFPFPKSGEEAMANHNLRYFGGGYDREYAWFPVRPNGDSYRVGFRDRIVGAKNLDSVPHSNLHQGVMASYTAPPTLQGTVFIIHEPVDHIEGGRSAWIYNAGQRRVRRAPDLAYDNIVDGTEGLRVTDQYNGFNGATDRFDWKLQGKREVYVPYNNYKIGDKSVKYADILDKNTVKSDLMRYELHRVWVVEATLKSGQKHIFGKRTFYLDEDSWMVLIEDLYDSRGDLWRAALHGFRQNYDANVPWHSVQLWHDLNSGAYLVSNLDNEVRAPIVWNLKDRWSNFQPDALRRKGAR